MHSKFTYTDPAEIKVIASHWSNYPELGNDLDREIRAVVPKLDRIADGEFGAINAYFHAYYAIDPAAARSLKAGARIALTDGLEATLDPRTLDGAKVVMQVQVGTGVQVQGRYRDAMDPSAYAVAIAPGYTLRVREANVQILNGERVVVVRAQIDSRG